MCLHLRVEASLIKSLHEFSWALGVDVANARTRLDMLGFPAQPVVDARAMLSVKAEIEWPGEAGEKSDESFFDYRHSLQQSWKWKYIGFGRTFPSTNWGRRPPSYECLREGNYMCGSCPLIHSMATKGNRLFSSSRKQTLETVRSQSDCGRQPPLSPTWKYHQQSLLQTSDAECLNTYSLVNLIC